MSTSELEGTSRAEVIVRALPLLSSLRPEVVDLIANSFTSEHYEFGSVLAREGDEADAFYVIVSGDARVVRLDEDGEEVGLNTLGAGESFGEIALLRETTRSATVRASSPVEAMRLDRGVFLALLGSAPDLRAAFEAQAQRHSRRDFLRLTSAFARASAEAIEAMVEALTPLTVPDGQKVLEEGAPPSEMFLVREGRLRATRSKDEGRAAFLRKGDFFGEAALFKDEPQTASVEAVTDCELLVLDGETFRALVESHPEVRGRVEERILQEEYRYLARVPLDFADEMLPAQAEAQKAAVPLVEGAVGTAAEDDFEGVKQERIKKFPFLWQIDEADCGAACLTMVVRHHGRNVSLAAVRQAVGTGVDGTSLGGIQSGGEALGLDCKAVKASKSRLDEMPLPAIVHWEGIHWVVLYDVAERSVRVADPALGRRKVDRAEFEEKWSGFAVLSEPTDALADLPEQQRNAGWLWDFFRPYKATMIKATVLALIAAALAMAIPAAGAVIVDEIVPENDVSALNIVVAGMLGVLLAMVGATIGQRYLLSKAAVSIDGESLDFITGKLLSLPMSYFNSRRTGDIERRLQGMQQIRQFVVQSGVEAMSAAMQLLAAVVLMFFYSPLLTGVFLAVVPFYVALMRFSTTRLKPMFDSLEEAYGKYTSRQIDAIRGIETVKAMGAEPSLRQLILKQFTALSGRLFRADFLIMVYEGAIQFVTLLSLALFLWVGALQVMDGAMSIGEFLSFNALVVLANGPILMLLTMWDQLQLSSVLVDRLNDIVEHDPEQGADHSGLKEVPTLEGRIRFSNVGFSYGGAVPVKILDGITFEVEPGTTVAIVGRSGSGKTTLIKCLAGLLEPTEGSIYYDEVNLTSIDYRSLRRQIGIVLQESYLFDETIAGNIAFGREDPDMERVVWAARTASAHSFIARLPLAYETRVGESGLLLSGGQKQRIAIARALYNQPPVLIFDEATSALDTESEKAVRDNMDELLHGRTSFVIAHRLSTIRDADVIFVLERGSLVEQGTHEELMERRGLYFYLQSQQLAM